MFEVMQLLIFGIGCFYLGFATAMAQRPQDHEPPKAKTAP